MTVKIKLREVSLTIDGDYQSSEPMTHDYPGSEESFEVERVTTVSGDDIMGLVENDLAGIEELALEAIHDQQDGEEAENEERRREDRRAS